MATPIATHTITRKDAQHVLHVMGYDGGLTPGGFITKLIEAAVVADDSNIERLARGFEGLISAVRVYKEVPGGVEVLREIATEGSSPF